MTLQNKVEKIIDYFLSKDARIWSVGTDFWNTWERLHKTIYELNIEKKNSKQSLSIKRIDEEKYYLIFSSNIITPTTNPDKTWKKSALTQFIQSGAIFSFWSHSHVDNVDDIKIHEEYTINFEFGFLEVMDKDYMDSLPNIFLKSLQKSLISTEKREINFGFSLFLSILHSTKFSFNSIKNYKFEKIKSRNVGKYGHIIDSHKIDSDKFNYFESNTYKKAYGALCKNLNEYFKTEQIIELLIFFVENNIFKIVLSIKELGNVENTNKYQKMIKTIEKNRLSFRDAIIKDRFVDKKKCNDLINAYPKEWYIEDCEAAHIFDVWRITLHVKKMIFDLNLPEEEIIDYIKYTVSNPNNGLLMPKQWHYFFDKKLFSFDQEGNIIILVDERFKDRLDIINFNSTLNKVRINPKTLNCEMLNFLKLKI